MVVIVALTLTIITAIYAYFNASVGDSASSDIKLLTIMWMLLYFQQVVKFSLVLIEKFLQW